MVVKNVNLKFDAINKIQKRPTFRKPAFRLSIVEDLVLYL